MSVEVKCPKCGAKLIADVPVKLSLPVIGSPGSKSNPYPLNKMPQAGYLYPINGGGQSGSEVKVGGKTWFVFDPLSTMTWATVIIKGYNNTTLRYWKQVQTKAGVDVQGEVALQNQTGDTHHEPSPARFVNSRFLYAVEGSGLVDIYVQYY